MKRKSTLKISLFSFQDIITSVTGVMILLTLLLALELKEKTETSPPVQTQTLISDLETQIENVRRQSEQLALRIKQANQASVDLINTSTDEIEEEIKELEIKLESLNDKTKELNTIVKNLTDTKSKLNEEEKSKEEMEAGLDQAELSIKAIKMKLTIAAQGLMVLIEPRPGDFREPWIIEVFSDKILAASARNKKNILTFEDEYKLERWLNSQKSNRSYFFLLGHRGGFNLLQKTKQKIQEKGFDYGLDLLLDNQNAIK
jgi:hypothetical protein